MTKTKTIEERVKETEHKLHMDITDRRGWRQEWDMFSNDIRKEIRKEHKSIIRTALQDHEKQVREETAKAFGGCTKCYGKGYATFAHDLHVPADFVGDKSCTLKGNPVVPCSCDRGKQMESILQSERDRAVGGIRKLCDEIGADSYQIHFFKENETILTTPALKKNIRYIVPR